MEKANWITLQYFLSMKWKSWTGEIYNTSCPQCGKVELENSTVFHVHQVEKFDWSSLLHFMSMKWKCLTREIYIISYPPSRKL